MYPPFLLALLILMQMVRIWHFFFDALHIIIMTPKIILHSDYHWLWQPQLFTFDTTFLKRNEMRGCIKRLLFPDDGAKDLVSMYWICYHFNAKGLLKHFNIQVAYKTQVLSRSGIDASFTLEFVWDTYLSDIFRYIFHIKMLF